MSKKRPVSIASWAPPGLVSEPPLADQRLRLSQLIAGTSPAGSLRDRIALVISPERLSIDLRRQAQDWISERVACYEKAAAEGSLLTSTAAEREAISSHAPAIIELSEGIGRDIRCIDDIGTGKVEPFAASRLINVRGYLNNQDRALLAAMRKAYETIDQPGNVLISIIRDRHQGIPGVLRESAPGSFAGSHLNQILKAMLALRTECEKLGQSSPAYNETRALDGITLIRYRQGIGGESEATEALARSMHLFNSLYQFFKALGNPLINLDDLAKQLITLFKNHLNLLFNAISGQALTYLPEIDRDPEAAGSEAEYMLIRLRIINECLMGLYINRKQAHILGMASE